MSLVVIRLFSPAFCLTTWVECSYTTTTTPTPTRAAHHRARRSRQPHCPIVMMARVFGTADIIQPKLRAEEDERELYLSVGYIICIYCMFSTTTCKIITTRATSWRRNKHKRLIRLMFIDDDGGRIVVDILLSLQLPCCWLVQQCLGCAQILYSLYKGYYCVDGYGDDDDDDEGFLVSGYKYGSVSSIRLCWLRTLVLSVVQ